VFSKFLHFAFYSQPSTLPLSWARRGLDLNSEVNSKYKCMYLFGYAFRFYDTITRPTIATTTVLTSIFLSWLLVLVKRLPLSSQGSSPLVESPPSRPQRFLFRHLPHAAKRCPAGSELGTQVTLQCCQALVTAGTMTPLAAPVQHLYLPLQYQLLYQSTLSHSVPCQSRMTFSIPPAEISFHRLPVTSNPSCTDAGRVVLHSVTPRTVERDDHLCWRSDSFAPNFNVQLQACSFLCDGIHTEFYRLG